MNIYIYNCSNTFNYGSMMMGENFINYFNKTSDIEKNYFIETLDDVNTERLKIATGYKKIYSVKQDSLFGKYNRSRFYILSYLGIMNIVDTITKDFDLIIVLGGDDFTEDYGWKGPIINTIKFNLLKKAGLKVVMLGQTMGPYHSFRKPIMKRLLRKMDIIYSRDPITYRYLRRLGLENVEIADDLALMPVAKQNMMKKTKEYITYCPSELIYRYSKEGKRSEWIEFNVFMIDKIMDRFSDKKIVLLAHVLKPAHVDDRKIAKELYDITKEVYKERIIYENKEMYPFEIRNYIQQSFFTISSRMHPVVSSIQCEIPVIALAYSSKYWGIIGERYELEDYILDVRYLDYEEMKVKFIGLINRIEIEYEQIQKKMYNKNKLANESIIKMLEEIAKL